ncbi:MAG: chromate transporter [Oscillospiraceae bacterium]|jgi:chromate transporter|nr:chromate transporter [Oscillospiraceae bacterium]
MALIGLYGIFLKIGFFTVGGGMAMLPLIQKELVSRGLMTLTETVDMVALSQMTPGPFAINAATFAGMKLYGAAGAAVATLGVITPSAVLATLVAKFFIAYSKKSAVADTMSAVRPVVMGLILAAALDIGYQSVLRGGAGGTVDVPVLVMACIGLALLLAVKKLSPILLIAVCGIAGAVFLQPK